MADFGEVVDQVRVANQRSARTGSIIRFVWHHQAGTDDDATINVMVTASREVSATYTVSNDDPKARGWSRITGVVPERDCGEAVASRYSPCGIDDLAPGRLSAFGLPITSTCSAHS